MPQNSLRLKGVNGQNAYMLTQLHGRLEQLKSTLSQALRGDQFKSLQVVGGLFYHLSHIFRVDVPLQPVAEPEPGNHDT